MSHIVKKLFDRGLLKSPTWLPLNCHYLTIMGSLAYGCADSSDKHKSDFDVYGFCIPPREDVFPHLAGEIRGFGTQKKSFEQFQQHHCYDADALGGKGREYDFTIFSIVKYFDLLMDNNPNILDSIFTPQDCVLHVTAVGNMVRENRKMFLSKVCFAKYKGYSYSQMHKMQTKDPQGKRKEIREKYGFDLKFGLHLVRLLSEVEQILIEGDIDLQRNREQLKAIRRGEVTKEEILKIASDKERTLERLYAESTLQAKPDEPKIKQLLLSCLEHHYGSLEKCISEVGWAEGALKEVDLVLSTIRSKLYNA